MASSDLVHMHLGLPSTREIAVTVFNMIEDCVVVLNIIVVIVSYMYRKQT